MSYTITKTIKYSGSDFDASMMDGLEMFASFKEAHNIGIDATDAYLNAPGLLSYSTDKNGLDLVYTQIWETEEAYNAWKSSFVQPVMESGWSII